MNEIKKCYSGVCSTETYCLCAATVDCDAFIAEDELLEVEEAVSETNKEESQTQKEETAFNPWKLDLRQPQQSKH